MSVPSALTDDSDLPSIVTSNIPGPRSRDWAQRLAKVESPDTTYLSDDFPIFWTGGKGCLVFDDDGNRYLDLTSSFGVLGIGHCHPDVQSAIELQSSRLIHGMGDVHPSVIKVRLLEKIVQRSPINDARVILGINGSDAIEAALKTALLATGRPGVLAFHRGYHGLSYGALEPTERTFFREPFRDQRGRFASHLPFGCAMRQVEAAFIDPSLEIGAVIAEPIQGRGGINIPPAEWLRELKQMCSRHGVLLILDEIFTGWGRTGSWFACQFEEVVPDLLCMGKAMGGGMPISACIASSQLMEKAWRKSGGEARHTYTYLGHPLSCASALAAINVIESEKLVDRSRETGQTLLSALSILASDYNAVIKSVRGRGLMIGIELFEPSLSQKIVLSALKAGIILLPAGEFGEVIEIIPPYAISSNQIDFCLDVLDKIFRSLR